MVANILDDCIVVIWHIFAMVTHNDLIFRANGVLAVAHA